MGVAFKGVSSGLLPPLGIIFALLTGFVAADVWADFGNAKVAVNREAGALREVTLIASSLGGETEARLRELVRSTSRSQSTRNGRAWRRRAPT